MLLGGSIVANPIRAGTYLMYLHPPCNDDVGNTATLLFAHEYPAIEKNDARRNSLGWEHSQRNEAIGRK